MSASINTMKNKVQELKGLGFHVEFCGTVQRDLGPPASLVDVANGHAVLPQFLFLTPEYACLHATELQAVQMDVILCAVDEVQEPLGASTLRPKYANMPSVLRKVAGNRFPIILTSSTISRDDQDLLAHQFDMQDPFIFFKPIPCDVSIPNKGQQSIKQDLHHLLDKEGRTSIFCHKRGETDTIVNALNKDSPGIAMPYHATLRPFVGEATLAAFTTGNVKVLATTMLWVPLMTLVWCNVSSSMVFRQTSILGFNLWGFVPMVCMVWMSMRLLPCIMHLVSFKFLGTIIQSVEAMLSNDAWKQVVRQCTGYIVHNNTAFINGSRLNMGNPWLIHVKCALHVKTLMTNKMLLTLHWQCLGACQRSKS